MSMATVCTTETFASSTVETCENPLMYQVGFMLDLVLVIVVALMTFKILKR